jgi:HK97 gp10 family phage protein
MPATLKSRLDGIAAELQPKVGAAVKAGAEIVSEAAVANLVSGGHVLNDELGPAIHVERKGAAEYSVEGGDETAFYGHMVEHGTSHSPPYPFLVPALEEHEDEVLFLVQGALEGL